MTLRLARVFRHLLANSARPLISLYEVSERQARPLRQRLPGL
jgi:hypothetical protein